MMVFLACSSDEDLTSNIVGETHPDVNSDLTATWSDVYNDRVAAAPQIAPAGGFGTRTCSSLAEKDNAVTIETVDGTNALSDVYSNTIGWGGNEIIWATADAWRRKGPLLPIEILDLPEDQVQVKWRPWRTAINKLRDQAGTDTNRPGKLIKPFGAGPQDIEMSNWVADVSDITVFFYPECLDEPETCGEIYGYVFGKFGIYGPDNKEAHYPGFDSATIDRIAEQKRGKWRKRIGTDGIERRVKKTNADAEQFQYVVRFFSEFAPVYFGNVGLAWIWFKSLNGEKIRGSHLQLYEEFIDMNYKGTPLLQIKGVNIMCPEWPWPHTPAGWANAR